MPELIRILINNAMVAERQQYLQAEPYQRTPERRGQANATGMTIGGPENRESSGAWNVTPPPTAQTIPGTPSSPR